MGKMIFDETNGLWYEKKGDYYLPCLSLPSEKDKPIGLWGQRHLRYLKEHKRLFYLNLLTIGRLNEYLVSVDERAGRYVFSVGKGVCRQAGSNGTVESGKPA